MKNIKKITEGFLANQYNSKPKEIIEAFQEVLVGIATLEVSLEKSHFKQGLHDPSKGLRVQRTKEEFIQNIEDTGREISSLQAEYEGSLPRGGFGPSDFGSKLRSY